MLANSGQLIYLGPHTFGRDTRVTVEKIAHRSARIVIELPPSVPITLGKNNHVFEQRKGRKQSEKRLYSGRHERVLLKEGEHFAIGDYAIVMMIRKSDKEIRLRFIAPSIVRVLSHEVHYQVTHEMMERFPCGQSVFWVEVHNEDVFLFRGKVEGWRDAGELAGWKVKIGSVEFVHSPFMFTRRFPSSQWETPPRGFKRSQPSAMGLFASPGEAINHLIIERVTRDQFRQEQRLARVAARPARTGRYRPERDSFQPSGRFQ
jgi:sRNA-binding carbon storage regulator CsrA